MVLPCYNDSARHSPKLAAPLRTKFKGGLPADSESTAQLHPGPLPLLYRAKVTTRYYQTTTTPLDTRPNLPLLYGPSFGTSPPTRSPVPDCTGTCGASPRTPATNAKRTATQAYMRRRPSDLPLLNGPSHSKSAADR